MKNNLNTAFMQLYKQKYTKKTADVFESISDKKLIKHRYFDEKNCSSGVLVLHSIHVNNKQKQTLNEYRSSEKANILKKAKVNSQKLVADYLQSPKKVLLRTQLPKKPNKITLQFIEDQQNQSKSCGRVSLGENFKFSEGKQFKTANFYKISPRRRLNQNKTIQLRKKQVLETNNAPNKKIRLLHKSIEKKLPNSQNPHKSIDCAQNIHSRKYFLRKHTYSSVIKQNEQQMIIKPLVIHQPTLSLSEQSNSKKKINKNSSSLEPYSVIFSKRRKVTSIQKPNGRSFSSCENRKQQKLKNNSLMSRLDTNIDAWEVSNAQHLYLDDQAQTLLLKN